MFSGSAANHLCKTEDNLRREPHPSLHWQGKKKKQQSNMKIKRQQCIQNRRWLKTSAKIVSSQDSFSKLPVKKLEFTTERFHV